MIEERRPLATWPALRGLYLLFIPALYLHGRLMWDAQSFLRPFLLLPVFWAILYFPLVDRLGPRLFDDWDPGLPRPVYVSEISGLCFIVAFSLLQAMIWLSLTPPIETPSALKAKYPHLTGAQTDSWRLVLQDGSHFYVPYPAAMFLKAGDPVTFTHRDGLLGVRFIVSYRIKDLPPVTYNQGRDAPRYDF